MKTLRFVTCGAGCRGTSLTCNVLSDLDGVEVVGVCDLYEDKAESLACQLEKKGARRPRVYTDYAAMFAETAPDAVLVATAWETHVEVAVAAMRLGIAVAMEVGGAYSEAECRALVETYEETKTPFMFMENCCFDKEELLTTSLVRNGLFGEVVYCHGAYAHDLREEIAYGDIRRHYRLRNYSGRNCENYPTHEVGPIARLLNINRGNRMVSLVSRSSKACGLHAFVQDKPELDDLKDRVFAQGDIVETLITCEGGELISLRLDTTLPRLYSREFTVRGTKGMYTHDTDTVLIEGRYEEWDSYAKHTGNSHLYYDPYLPDLWRNLDPKAMEKGHGGMDWLEFVAFVDALRADKPMPIDVYDAAAWMAVTYLSEESIRRGGAVVEIPDFTNGRWKTRLPEDVTNIPSVAEKA